jgi:cyclin A
MSRAPLPRSAKNNGALKPISANVAANRTQPNPRPVQKRPNDTNDQNPDQPAAKRPKTSNNSPSFEVCTSPKAMDLSSASAEKMDVDGDNDINEQYQGENDEFEVKEEFLKETYSSLKENEEQFSIEKQARASFDVAQKEVTFNMRAILVDWLVEVAEEYGLRPQTLFLAIDYLDRYLTLRHVARQSLQLIGITCMFIAAKYEEIYPPTLDDFVFITDNTYKREMIISCERDILIALEFKLTVATPFHFLRKYLHYVAPNHTFLHNFARYVLELTFVDYNYNRYLPSELAVVVVTLAVHALKDAQVLEHLPKLERLTACQVNGMNGQLREVYNTLIGAHERPQRAVVEKFAIPKYESVATLSVPRLF